MTNFPWGQYTFHASTGFVGSDVEYTQHIGDYFEEEEWESFSDSRKESFLEELLDGFLANNVTMGFFFKDT